MALINLTIGDGLASSLLAVLTRIADALDRACPPVALSKAHWDTGPRKNAVHVISGEAIWKKEQEAEESKLRYEMGESQVQPGDDGDGPLESGLRPTWVSGGAKIPFMDRRNYRE